MRKVYGLVDSFEICCNPERNGNCFYLDDSSGCGVVWFPSIKSLRLVYEWLGRFPHGSLSGRCSRCSNYTGDWRHPPSACAEWIDDLIKRGSNY